MGGRRRRKRMRSRKTNWSWHERQADIQESLPVAWKAQLQSESSWFPVQCLVSLMQAIVDLDSHSSWCVQISWLEVAFLLRLKGFMFW